MSADLENLVTEIAQRARAASLVLGTVPTEAKNEALRRLADGIDASHVALLAANRQDLASSHAAGLGPAQIERLTLTPGRLDRLSESVRQVVGLPDPVGEVLEEWTRPNGLKISFEMPASTYSVIRSNIVSASPIAK